MSAEESIEKGASPTGADSSSQPKRAKERLRRVSESEKLPLTAHLEELRARLIRSALTVFLVFMALYFLSDGLLAILSAPIKKFGLYAIAPAEIFFTYIKISFYGALIISFPMLLYHAWEFSAPGLLKSERAYTGWFVFFGVLFFTLGGAFCYFLILPFGLDFLLSFAGPQIRPQITINNYFDFVLKLTLAFGLVFQTPIVIVFLAKLGLIGSAALKRARPYFIVLTFALAAILTPPDVVTQIALAMPMIALFELSALVIRIFSIGARDEDEKTTDDEKS